MVKTVIIALRSLLEECAALARKDAISEFVKIFVPPDLSVEDAASFTKDLTEGEEAEGAWRNLKAEVIAITEGASTTIEGDDVEGSAEVKFFFIHPLLPDCDREVVFKCTDGTWHADG
jgi:hypothetical protein